VSKEIIDDWGYNEDGAETFAIPADCEEVDRAIAAGLSAAEMLRIADSGAIRAFRRADAALLKALERVRKSFPDAEYYTASGTFCLLLGPAHGDANEGGRQHQERIALTGKANIDGGDF
jgi:hypothetical protein